MAELSCQVRDVVRAMSAEERESASIKVVQRLLQEKHSVSEDTVQERKKEIKDLFCKELELAELSCQARDVVRAMSAEERESASIKLLQKLLQEKHSVSEDTVQERKREIKDLFFKELELAREEDDKEEEEAEEEESNERETKTKTPATIKQGRSRIRRRDASAENKENKKQKENHKVWSKETERLKALIIRLSNGMPKHINFRAPPAVWMGLPTDQVVQERIAAFLKSKGLNTLTPNNDEIAAFQKKVSIAIELAGIDTANIVESSGARPRRSGSSLNIEKRKEDSDDDESLLSAPLERKDGYNLADSDSD